MTHDDLQRFIQRQGIQAELLLLEMPTPTVESAAQALQVGTEQILKSLLFFVDGEPLLVLANGTRRVMRGKLGRARGVGRRQVRLADPAEVAAWTGFAVGTVPPFGHRRPVAVLIDQSVLDQATIYGGGGGHSAMLRLAVSELLRVTDGTPADLTADS